MSQERPSFTAPQSNSTNDRPKIPVGMQQAICISVIDYGTQRTEWKGQEKWQRKIAVGFEFPKHQHVFDEEKGEQPLVESKEFTWTFYKDSKFKKFINGWRGKALTQQEELNFDVLKMLGAPAWITIIANESKSNGKTYHNIDSATLMDKETRSTLPAPHNPLKFYHISQGFECDEFQALYEWQKKKIQESQEYLESQEKQATSSNSQTAQKAKENLQANNTAVLPQTKEAFPATDVSEFVEDDDDLPF